MSVHPLLRLILWILFAFLCVTSAYVLVLFVGLSVGFGEPFPYFQTVSQVVSILLGIGFMVALFQIVKTIRSLISSARLRGSS